MRREDLPRPPRVLHTHCTPLPLGEEISRTKALGLVRAKNIREQDEAAQELLDFGRPLHTTYK